MLGAEGRLSLRDYQLYIVDEILKGFDGKISLCRFLKVQEKPSLH